MSTFYYSTDGTPVGPVGVEELRGLISSGIVREDAHILQQGDANWTTARDHEVWQATFTRTPAPPTALQYLAAWALPVSAATLVLMAINGVGDRPADQWYPGVLFPLGILCLLWRSPKVATLIHNAHQTGSAPRLLASYGALAITGVVLLGLGIGTYWWFKAMIYGLEALGAPPSAPA